MNSSEYWRRREEEALKHYITDEKQYDKELHRIYENMLDSVQSEINAFYGKYAASEGITLAEAKKRVSKLDIKAYERKAAKYVKEKTFSKTANEEMRLYNATMKINRLEMLKANIGLELIAGHNELEKFMGGILKGRTNAELKRQAGILGKTITNNAQLANSIVNASFHNATFSDRIWQYQDIMKADLSKLIQQGMIAGKNPRALAKDLRKYFIGDETLKNGKNGAVYATERLMRTELARVQTEAQKQSFKRNGFTYFEFITNSGCCPICAAINGKHYKVDKMQIGLNAPPIHPHCRCSTAAWEDDAEYEAWLDYLDKGGTTAQWNATGKAAWNELRRTEKEESKPKYTYRNTVVDTQLLKSTEYRKRIDKISNNTEVNRSIWNRATEMLAHRTGTKFEDLAYIDSVTGKSLINKAFDKENFAKPSAKMNDMLSKAEPYTIIGIHNHPASSVPSIADIHACIERQYLCDIVVCHDGKIYKYSVDSQKFIEPIAISALANLEKMGYNSDVGTMFLDAGITMGVL